MWIGRRPRTPGSLLTGCSAHGSLWRKRYPIRPAASSPVGFHGDTPPLAHRFRLVTGNSEASWSKAHRRIRPVVGLLGASRDSGSSWWVALYGARLGCPGEKLWLVLLSGIFDERCERREYSFIYENGTKNTESCLVLNYEFFTYPRRGISIWCDDRDVPGPHCHRRSLHSWNHRLRLLATFRHHRLGLRRPRCGHRTAQGWLQAHHDLRTRG